jgi:hypothetical protein
MLLTWASSRGLPTLYLDFLSSESADSRLTISGGAGGTRVNSSGNIVSASAPRFDYDPVSLAARGLLVEEQRTNLLLQSAGFSSAPWAASASTLTANAAGSPNGASNATKLVADATSTNGHQVLQAVSVTSGTTYTLTAYMKQGEYGYGNLLLDAAAFGGTNQIGNFDLVNGAASVGLGTPTVSITNVGGGWYRCTITATASATVSANVALRVNSTYSNAAFTGTGTSGIYAWGAQLEAGSFATSYIPTTTAQVTRTADSEAMTAVSSWFNATAGTFYVEGDSLVNVASGVPLLSIDDGTTGVNSLDIRWRPSATGAVISSGSATQADLSIPGLTVGSVYKLWLAYAANDFAFIANGGAPVTDSAGAVPVSPTTLRIGRASSGNPMNGHIRKLLFFPVRQPNATGQVLTQ